MLVIGATPESCLRPMNVAQEKEAILQDLSELIPDFDNQGEILKWDVHDLGDEFPAYRPWPDRVMSHITPISNLFNVGDAARPSGTVGVDGCAETGKIVVKEIRKRFKPITRRG